MKPGCKPVKPQQSATMVKLAAITQQAMKIGSEPPVELVAVPNPNGATTWKFALYKTLDMVTR